MGFYGFVIRKRVQKNTTTDLDRDHGWKTLNDSGLHGIRMVSIDDDWSAFRFSNEKFIKSLKKQ